MSSLPLAPDFHDTTPREPVELHRHREGQLLVATHGAMDVRLGDARLRLSPSAAIWVPPGLAHSAVVTEPTAFRGVLVEEGPSALLPTRPRAIAAGPVLLAAVPELAGIRRALASALVLDVLLQEADGAPPLPREEPWSELCLAALANLPEAPELDAAAQSARQSRRTFTRGFRAATGRSWAGWLREARLARAAALLSGGATVTEAALAVGYATPSAFSVAFRRQRGVAPIALRRDDP